MRLTDLFETNYQDIYSKSFKSFLEDYKDIYDKTKFVVFTDSEYLTFEDNTEKNMPSGLMCFPVHYVVRNPSLFAEYANKKYLHVIVSTGNRFKVNEATEQDIYQLGQLLKLKKETIAEFIEEYKDSFKLSSKIFYGYVFNELLKSEVNGDKINTNSATNQKMHRRIVGLGYDMYLDTTKNTAFSILNKEYASVGVFMKQVAYLVDDTYKMQGETESSQYYKDREHIKLLMEHISKGLKTKLNNDPIYPLGLEFYAWTVDGIEIKLSIAFSETRTDTSDDVYYIIEAETPYGMLVKTTNPSYTYSDISDYIRKTYVKMNNVRSDWEPTNRDIFMGGIRKKYKLLTQHFEDMDKAFERHYPNIWHYGKVYNIKIPWKSYYTKYDRLFINQLLEFFMGRGKQSKEQIITKLMDDDFDFDRLLFYPLPDKITPDLILRIAKLYDIAKKKFPARTGWYLFKEV